MSRSAVTLKLAFYTNIMKQFVVGGIMRAGKLEKSAKWSHGLEKGLALRLAS